MLNLPQSHLTQALAIDKHLGSQDRTTPVSGGDAERATPVPIPNTEVKPLRADGTARAAVWESRSPPDF